MENKIPFYRFRGEQYDKDGDIFGEMQNVDIDYLQGLSRNELDAIPMAWLYDWAHVSGLAGYKDVQNWLDSLKDRRQRPRALQIAQTQNAIVFTGCLDRRNKFYLHYKNGKKVCELYKGFCFVDGKRFKLTDEQMARFHKVYSKFQDDFEKAKNNQEGFRQVTKDGATVYFRRLPNFEYQFISQLANGDVRQDKMIVTNDSVRFNFLGLESDIRLWCSRRDNPQVDDDFILFDTDDEYLNKELKYICNKTSKEDIEYLNAIDGFKRFYVDKEVYDVSDISVSKVERVPLSFFNRSVRYTLYLTLKGKEYVSSEYCQGNKEITLCCHAKTVEIKITEKLKRVIGKMIDALPYDEQYDSIKRRGKTVFATISDSEDSSVSLPNILNQLGLNYQKIHCDSHGKKEKRYIVWDTAYHGDTFQLMMLKLNGIFKQRSICIGSYCKRKYDISLWREDGQNDLKYSTVDTYQAIDVVDALKSFYAKLFPGEENGAITLGELKKAVSAAAGETVNGGYVRGGRFNLLMRCNTPLELKEGLRV